jgi:hypothetical protein
MSTVDDTRTPEPIDREVRAAILGFARLLYNVMIAEGDVPPPADQRAYRCERCGFLSYHRHAPRYCVRCHKFGPPPCLED